MLSSSTREVHCSNLERNTDDPNWDFKCVPLDDCRFSGPT
jgi:hypothetical protein